MNIFMNHYDKLLYTLQMWATFMAIWPLEFKAGKFKTFFHTIFWYICMVYITSQNYFLIKAIFLSNQKDFINMMKSAAELTGTLEVIFNQLFFRIRKQQLQKLLFDVKQWTHHEKKMRKKILHDTYIVQLSLVIIIIVVIHLLYMLLPVITDRILPLNIVYPFPISKFWVYCVAYTMNIFFLLQMSVIIIIDMIIISTLWKVVCKFNLLGIQMHSVITADELRACIISYQNIFNYVQEIDCIVSYMLLKLTIVTFVYLISSGLLILNNAPIMETSIFCIVTSISIWRLYVYCWSAEAMTDVSYNLSWQIYDSPWIDAPRNVRETIFMIVQRCQKPITVSGTALIPIISIRFCGSVFYISFSYFMALRTILR